MSLGNCLILGDSYSTFGGYIPEGFSVYYSTERTNPPIVPTVDKTWWEPLIREHGGTIVQNNSWSGSTVCYRGYNGADTSKSSSFCHRLDVLEERGFFGENEIDTIFLFGGTNDAWSGARLGKYRKAKFDRAELYTFRPAFAYMLYNLKKLAPSARIITIANCAISDKIEQSIKKISADFGVECVMLENIDKQRNHPTELGMKMIREQVEAAIIE